jgi:hypothetical protein
MFVGDKTEEMSLILINFSLWQIGATWANLSNTCKDNKLIKYSNIFQQNIEKD